MKISTRFSIAITAIATFETALFFIVFQQIVIPNELAYMIKRSRDMAQYIQVVAPKLTTAEQQELLEQFQKTQPDLSYMLILDRNGKALAHSDRARVGMVFDDPGSLRGARENRAFEQLYTRDVNIKSSPYHGERIYDILVPYLDQGVQKGAISVGISLKRLDATKAKYYRIFLIFSCTLLLSLAIVARVFYLYTVSPTRELLAAIQQVRQGKFDLLLTSSRRNDELGIIAREIQTMAQKLEEFIGAISAKKRELREFIDHFRAFVCKLSPDGQILVVNQTAMQSISGDEQEVIGKELWNTPWFNAELVPIIKERVSEAAAGKSVSFEVSGAFIVPGNRTFSVSLKPVLNEHRAVSYIIAEGFDITERKIAEANLIKLNQELEQANASKEQFLAILSHELRNPLTPIIAGAELLQRMVPLTEAKAQRLLEIIRQNAFLQSRLVDDLLDLSRISRGKLTFRYLPFDLREIILSSVDRVMPDARSAKLSLVVEDLPEAWVRGDSDRLQQVMVNLLENAIKFSRAGGIIVTRLWVRERFAVIEVSDTGIGIEPELLPHLFEMFRQGEVTGKKRGGMGIGLALVKLIVEKHEGTVKAESAGPGKGSRFTVEIPLTKARKVTARVESSSEAVSAPRKILFVEDNPDTRVLIADQLSLLGCDVVTAENAEEALKLLEGFSADCILSDLGLPGMDGYEFMRTVRKNPLHKETPAFAVTGFGQETDVQKSKAAGYDGHFVKPIDISDLVEKICNFRR